MSPVTIILIAAGMAFVTAITLLYYAIKYQDEEVGVVLGIGSLIAFIVVGACFTEAVKEAKIQNGTAVEEKAK